MEKLGIDERLYSVHAGDSKVTTTDPERIFIEYKSVFEDAINSYLKPIVVIEAGARSITEPYEVLVDFGQQNISKGNTVPYFEKSAYRTAEKILTAA